MADEEAQSMREAFGLLKKLLRGLVVLDQRKGKRKRGKSAFLLSSRSPSAIVSISGFGILFQKVGLGS